MNILPTASHPAWCDPLSYKPQLDADGSVSYEHRGASRTMRPAAQADADLTVRRTQLDDRSRFPWIGHVNVTLTATDTLSVGPDGDCLQVVVDLYPMDARMLATQLVLMAEQVEAARHSGGVMTCGAIGCSAPAVGIFCTAHGAAKTETERKRDERKYGKK